VGAYPAQKVIQAGSRCSVGFERRASRKTINFYRRNAESVRNRLLSPRPSPQYFYVCNTDSVVQSKWRFETAWAGRGVCLPSDSAFACVAMASRTGPRPCPKIVLPTSFLLDDRPSKLFTPAHQLRQTPWDFVIPVSRKSKIFG
jgi:hypothetical protein